MEKIEKYLRHGTNSVFAVVPAGGQYHVINCGENELEPVAHVAAYAEKWRAENHAITGCPCGMQWHYYHGEKHEPIQ